MSEIVVLAHAIAKSGYEKKLEEAMCAAVMPTHAEPGCLKYAFHRSAEDSRVFVMIEKWTSKEALDLHLKMPHIQTLFKKLPDLLAEPMKIQVYHALPEGLPEKLL